MRRRDLVSAALMSAASAAAAGTAGASAPPKKSETVGQYVDLSPLAIPSMEGKRLRNYIFAAIRVKLTPRADAQKLRDKEPWFRDAIVRAAHRAAYNLPTDFDRLDEPRFKAMATAEAGKVAGLGLVAGVQFTTPPQPQRRTTRRR
jgi:hypothetical protein